MTHPLMLVSAVYGDSPDTVGWHDCDLCSKSLIDDEALGELWYDDSEGLYVCAHCIQLYLAGEAHATGTSSE